MSGTVESNNDEFRYSPHTSTKAASLQAMSNHAIANKDVADGVPAYRHVWRSSWSEQFDERIVIGLWSIYHMEIQFKIYMISKPSAKFRVGRGSNPDEGT